LTRAFLTMKIVFYFSFLLSWTLFTPSICITEHNLSRPHNRYYIKVFEYCTRKLHFALCKYSEPLYIGGTRRLWYFNYLFIYFYVPNLFVWQREYEEFKVRINALVAKAQKMPEEGWTMQDGTPWPGNNSRDHPGMIQVLLFFQVLLGFWLLFFIFL